MTDKARATRPSTDGATVIAEVQGLIRALFPWALEFGEPRPEARLREDLNLDSLDLVELQVAIEDRLTMRFDPADDGFLEAFDTVGSLARHAALIRPGMTG